MLMLMSAVETGQMSASETGQMSAAEIRQMSTTPDGNNKRNFQKYLCVAAGLPLSQRKLSEHKARTSKRQNEFPETMDTFEKSIT